MSNLLTSYSSAANSMRTYEKAMEVVQNDTVNSNTPGYVRQSVSFSSLPFDVNNSQAGGVTVGAVVSSRDEYAEHSVQLQQSAYSMSSTIASQLSQLQPLFDLQSTTGVAGSLNTLYAAFSQLTVSPNDAQTRQAVLTAASGLTTAFNVTSSGLTTGASAVDASAQNAIKDLNTIVSDIQSLNVQMRTQSQSTPDPSVDARLHVDLENLSQYAGITSVQENDGTVSVYLNGQKPLLIGTTQDVLSVVTNSSGITVHSSDGSDVTALVSGGQLDAMVTMRNTLIPSYQSQLDQLAKNVADVINSQLNSGVDQSGNPGGRSFQLQRGSTGPKSLDHRHDSQPIGGRFGRQPRRQRQCNGAFHVAEQRHWHPGRLQRYGVFRKLGREFRAGLFPTLKTIRRPNNSFCAGQKLAFRFLRRIAR